MTVKHPAKFSDGLLSIFIEMIPDGSKVLDPFAGTGKIHLLPFETTGLEIEPEWAELHPQTICGDATNMPFADSCFDVICTSPTYGNRMADSHVAKDGSIRNTYTHTLGRKLHDNNSGKMQWGEKYRELHENAYKECYRVLKDNGLFILNVKNHIRKGKEVDVFKWHIDCLEKLGFSLIEVKTLKVRGNGFGANGKTRTNFEYVALLKRTNPTLPR